MAIVRADMAGPNVLLLTPTQHTQACTAHMKFRIFFKYCTCTNMAPDFRHLMVISPRQTRTKSSK